jgi:hypothetical protein
MLTLAFYANLHLSLISNYLINKQWLLPSDSQRKVSILDAAKLSLEQAEDSRNACRQQWAMLCLQVSVIYHITLYCNAILCSVVYAYSSYLKCLDLVYTPRVL